MRYLMVYTGNEINMCMTEWADKHKCVHTATYTHENTHVGVVVQICIPHTSAQMMRYVEDVWGKFHFCDDFFFFFGKCVYVLSLHLFTFFLLAHFESKKNHTNTESNEGSAQSTVSQRVVNQ